MEAVQTERDSKEQKKTWGEDLFGELTQGQRSRRVLWLLARDKRSQTQKL